MRQYFMKLSLVLTAVALVFLFGSVCFSATVVVNDDFDNGDLATNPNGTGSGWNIGSGNGAGLPTESGGAMNAPMTTEDGIGWAHSKDTFQVWNAAGTRVTWVIKGITVNTPHTYNMYLAYCWEMGIISSNQ